MPLPLITVSLWIQKDLFILLHNTNPIFTYVLIDAFIHFVVRVPIKSNNAETAAKTLLHHWITKFAPHFTM